MAKPRVFISSTFYDLRQIRADIDQFLKSLGYETVRNEVGAIPYGKEKPLEDDCVKEVEHCDILVSILGGRFGSESKETEIVEQQLKRTSITQRELKTAIEKEKQVYIFIDKNVNAEYQTYLINKDNKDINYCYVDDSRIYSFIEWVKNLEHNNNIKSFETAEDINNYLREQFAGLFQRFLDNQIRLKEYNMLKELDGTAKSLSQLVEFLSEQNKDKKEEIEQILMINHPIINSLKSVLGIKYNFYIEAYADLSALLTSFGYKELSVNHSDSDPSYVWKYDYISGYILIKISRCIFDEGGKLKNIMANNWEDSYIIKNVYQTVS